ncbi:unnamed protein product, partial [Rotaria socialis]
MRNGVGMNKKKHEIENNWQFFFKKLKQHIYDRLKVNINPSKDHQLSFVNDKTRTEQFSSIKSSSIEINCSLSSSFFIAMARKIIKSPSNFRGAKDDVIE